MNQEVNETTLIQEETQLDFLQILEVKQSVFQGPLALLLDLIRKKKMDIFSISLTQICTPYLTALKEMQTWNWDLSTEFFDIASLLILIKSKSLLPQIEEMWQDEKDEVDPEEELRRKLILYQTWQNISYTLGEQAYVGRDFFLRGNTSPKTKQEVIYKDEISLHQLIKAYHDILQKQSYYEAHTIEEEVSFQDYIDTLWKKLWQKKEISFIELMPKPCKGMNLILTFICILELAKRQYIYLVQKESNQILYIFLEKTAPQNLSLQEIA